MNRNLLIEIAFLILGLFSCDAQKHANLSNAPVMMTMLEKENYMSKPCVFPYKPANGHVTLADPTSNEWRMIIAVTCDNGYDLVGASRLFCSEGHWSYDVFPECVVQEGACIVNHFDGLQYKCVKEPGDSLFLENRECGNVEPSGTVMIPQCREPIYHSLDGELAYMHCDNGQWDYQPYCSPTFNDDDLRDNLDFRRDCCYAGGGRYTCGIVEMGEVTTGCW